MTLFLQGRVFTVVLLLFAVLYCVNDSTATSKIDERAPNSPVSRFGGAIAVSDANIFISEPTDFRNSGKVHVYERNSEGGWIHKSEIVGPDAKVSDRFGQNLAVLGSFLLVADFNSSEGVVQVYSPDEESGEYVHRATLRGATGDDAQSFGSSIVGAGNNLWIGAPGSNKGAGLVYSYRITEDGQSVQPVAILEGTNVAGRFGAAMAASSDLLVVGSPGFESGVGALHTYSLSDGMWSTSGSVEMDSTSGRTGFGSVLHITNGMIAAGTPRSDGMLGAVKFIRMDSGGSWFVSKTISSPDTTDRGMFGSRVMGFGNELWVSAPRSHGDHGALYTYAVDDSESSSFTQMSESNLSAGDFYGGSIAIGETVAVIGAPGDDYGLGSVYIYEKSGSDWIQSDFLFRDVETVDIATGEQLDCSDGLAGDFDCSEIDMVSYISNEDIGMSRGTRLNDVWGWTDPVTDKEYALVGHMEGMVILDVSNASSPVYLGTLPKTEGSRGNTWRDIKTFNDHAFIVADGSASHGIQIFDLTQLRDLKETPVTFEESARYGEVNSVHNIVINEETGFAYAVGSNSGGETCGGGLHMIDVNNPKKPVFAGCFADTTTGRNNSGSTHDSQCVVYHGPDKEHSGKEICLSANGTAISIADVTDKSNPVAISTGSYPGFAYVHQGWLTEDHQYFYQNDELDELTGHTEKTRTMIWDLTDLDDPIMIKEHFGPTSATDHNLYVNGQYMYQTNNASGLRVFDVSDPENPVEVGHFDTTPYGDDVAGFNGTWSSYPFFKSGNVIVTSRREGVFILKKKERGT